MRFDRGASNMDLLPRGYFRDVKSRSPPQLERLRTSERAHLKVENASRESTKARQLYVCMYVCILPAIVIAKKVVPLSVKV